MTLRRPKSQLQTPSHIHTDKQMAVMGHRELMDKGILCIMDTWIVKRHGKQESIYPDTEDLGGGKMLSSMEVRNS